jgi:serine/threonine-protein kinase
VHGGTLAISPDGMVIVYQAQGQPSRLFKRRLTDAQATPIDNTANANTPFFSPDGQWLGYVVGERIWKVRIDGGAPIAVGDLSAIGGASWGEDGFIVAGRRVESGLWRLPAAGGTAEQVTHVTPEDGSNDHRWPQVLPNGRGVLFSVSTGPEESARIVVLDARTGRRKDLLTGSATARYVLTGHLVYARNAELLAAPFDLDRLEITGSATRLAEGVNEDTDAAPEYALSGHGDLVYAPGWSGGTRNRLVLVDLEGHDEETAFPDVPVYLPRFSADGKQIAVTVGGAKNNIWLYDIARGVATRATNGRYHEALWTAVGHVIMS